MINRRQAESQKSDRKGILKTTPGEGGGWQASSSVDLLSIGWQVFDTILYTIYVASRLFSAFYENVILLADAYVLSFKRRAGLLETTAVTLPAS